MLTVEVDQIPRSHGVPLRGATERGCISLVFFLIGLVFSSWVPYIPAIKTRFQMSDSHLGASLLLIGLGAMLAMVAAPTIMRYLRNRSTIIAALAGLAATFTLVLSAPSLAVFYPALFAFGVVNGLCNVAINAQGSDFERAHQRPVMSSFHAFFSIGGFCGAAMTYLVLRLSLGEVAHAGVIIVAAGAAMVACRKWLPEDLMPFDAQGTGEFHLSLGLCAIALVALIALAVEGSITDWLTVYLQRAHTGALESAALGFVVFSGAMTVARLLGDRMKIRYTSIRVFQLGLLMAIGGFLGVLLTQTIGLTYVCIFITGLGLGNIVPIVFSQAGSIRGIDPAKAITAVSIAGYLGYLGSPPLIGYLSDLGDLRLALLVLIPFMLGILAIGTRYVR